MPGRNGNSRGRVLAALMVGTVLACGGANADPIFTAKGNFVDNRVKGTVTLTTPGGTKATQPAMIKEVQKPGSATEAMVQGAAPFVEYTAEQKAAINKRVTDTYAGVTVGKDPDAGYDCHGLTFKSGKQFINNDQVQKIIDDQGWKPPANGKAQKGDIVVYRKGGSITHSGIVEDVDNAGNVTKVRSKWGPWGEYVHAPDDVPKGQAQFGGVDYGAPTVLTGGAALKDPPIADDLKAFEFLPIVTMKPELLVETAINVFPVPELALSGALGGLFDYVLDVPETIGLKVSPGDLLTLFAEQLVDGFVSSAAMSASAGGWVVDEIDPGFVTWRATASAFLADDLPGFSIQSLLENVGGAFYRESIAGSVGRTGGPQVPAPATMALLAAALAALGAARLARR